MAGGQRRRRRQRRGGRFWTRRTPVSTPRGRARHHLNMYNPSRIPVTGHQLVSFTVLRSRWEARQRQLVGPLVMPAPVTPQRVADMTFHSSHFATSPVRVPTPPLPDFSQMSEEEQVAFVIAMTTDPNRPPTPPPPAAAATATVEFEDILHYELACMLALKNNQPMPERKIKPPQSAPRAVPRAAPRAAPREAPRVAQPPSLATPSGRVKPFPVLPPHARKAPVPEAAEASTSKRWTKWLPGIFSRSRKEPPKLVSVGSSRPRSASSNELGISPAPLVNNGNTCYMNSVIQAIMACEDFCIGLDGMVNAMAISGSGRLPTLPAASPFLMLTQYYNNNRGNPHGECMKGTLVQFKKGMGKLLPHFVKHARSQEDAGELIQVLIAKLAEDLESIGARGVGMNTVDQFFRMGTGIFYTCKTCTAITIEAQLATTTYILPSDQSSRNPSSIQMCIDNTFSKISHETKLCEVCENRGCTARVGVSTIGKYVCLQLPRFAEVRKMLKKITVEHSIVFPICDPTNGETIRSESMHLRSVVCHIGSTPDSGHYIAYVRNSRDNEWYLCNDSVISKLASLPTDRSVYQNGYLFIYER